MTPRDLHIFFLSSSFSSDTFPPSKENNKIQSGICFVFFFDKKKKSENKTHCAHTDTVTFHSHSLWLSHTHTHTHEMVSFPSFTHLLL